MAEYLWTDPDKWQQLANKATQIAREEARAKYLNIDQDPPVKPYDAQHAELTPEPKWWQVGFKIMAVDKAEWKVLHDLDVGARCEEYTCRHLMFLHGEHKGSSLCKVCFGMCDYEGEEED